MFNNGDNVEVFYGGRWLMGQITHVGRKTYTVWVEYLGGEVTVAHKYVRA